MQYQIHREKLLQRLPQHAMYLLGLTVRIFYCKMTPVGLLHARKKTGNAVLL